MKSKQIVFTKSCVAEVLENEVETPKDNEVQVRLAVSTICSGTERANLIGGLNVCGTGMSTFPRVLGYSSSRVVESVGKFVSDLKPGDRVAMFWTIHSEIVNVDENCAYKLPDSISFNDGALFHIATFPLAAIRKCHLEIGESAIVMGMGVLGLVTIPLLKAAGAVPIIAVDPIPEKREKAFSLGADYVLDPFSENFAENAKKLTNGGAKVGIEVTGVGAGLDGILDCMAKFGRVALLGCTRNKDFTIDYYQKVHFPGITLIGAHTIARPQFESSEGLWTQKDDISTVMKLTEMGRIKLSDMVDEVHSPLEASQIYSRLVSEKTFPIIQFDWKSL